MLELGTGSLATLGIAGAAVAAAVGLSFSRAQNRKGRMGGSISRAKQVWLTWALYTWFLLAPLVGLSADLSGPLRAVLLAFSGFMWLRGLVELFMLYVTKNWRPPLGVAHDAASALLLFGGLGWVLSAHPAPRAGLEAWGLAFVFVLGVSLVLETGYAVVFHRLVEGRTTGDDGVWFASADDPKFRRVNRVTAGANVPLVLFVAALLARLGAG